MGGESIVWQTKPIKGLCKHWRGCCCSLFLLIYWQAPLNLHLGTACRLVNLRWTTKRSTSCAIGMGWPLAVGFNCPINENFSVSEQRIVFFCRSVNISENPLIKQQNLRPTILIYLKEFTVNIEEVNGSFLRVNLWQMFCNYSLNLRVLTLPLETFNIDLSDWMGAGKLPLSKSSDRPFDVAIQLGWSF